MHPNASEINQKQQMQTNVNSAKYVRRSFFVGLSDLVSRIFPLLHTLLLINCFILAGCQELPELYVSKKKGSPISSKTDRSKINWEGLTIKRDTLPQSITDDQEADPINIGTADESTDKQKLVDSKQMEIEIITKTTLTETLQELDPAIFLGKSSSHLESKIGAPKALRKEGSVEVWQYQLSNCIVDFYIYKIGEDQVAKHTHMRSLFFGSEINKITCKKNLFQLNQKFRIKN